MYIRNFCLGTLKPSWVTVKLLLPKCNYSNGIQTVPLVYDDYNTNTVDSLTPVLVCHGMLGSRSNWTSISKQIHKTTGWYNFVLSLLFNWEKVAE